MGLFKVGEIALLRLSRDDVSQKEKSCYRALENSNPCSVMIIKVYDENTYLVAVLRKERTHNSDIEIPTADGSVFAKTKQLLKAYESFLTKTSQYSIHGHSKVFVREILDKNHLHYKNIAIKQQKRKEKSKAKRIKMLETKKSQRQLEMKYKKAYDIAVMNNDRETMDKIVEIVGCIPCQGKGSEKECRIGSSRYQSFNPKPLSGGKFSPK